MLTVQNKTAREPCVSQICYAGPLEIGQLVRRCRQSRDFSLRNEPHPRSTDWVKDQALPHHHLLKCWRWHHTCCYIKCVCTLWDQPCPNLQQSRSTTWAEAGDDIVQRGLQGQFKLGPWFRFEIYERRICDRYRPYRYLGVKRGRLDDRTLIQKPGDAARLHHYSWHPERTQRQEYERSTRSPGKDWSNGRRTIDCWRHLKNLGHLLRTLEESARCLAWRSHKVAHHYQRDQETKAQQRAVWDIRWSPFGFRLNNNALVDNLN